ncbi:hypothetical protein Ae201684P_020211 [Aphanomyces euteiches]|nr:hypothetical protein Ae201684P_020211 [Aphanomyces euteiches]
MNGEIDFYLNGPLRWGIELLVNGDKIGERMARFAQGGKYSALGVQDYAVIDLRGNPTGKVTNVSRMEKRVTLFFQLNDFSYHNVLSWSTSCDGRHYWTFLFHDTTVKMSMVNNVVHDTSGRSPKMSGPNVYAHIANNHWYDNSGHSFDGSHGAYALSEGNYFEKTTLPSLPTRPATSCRRRMPTRQCVRPR